MTTPAPAGPPAQDGLDCPADPADEAWDDQAPDDLGEAAGSEAGRDGYEPI